MNPLHNHPGGCHLVYSVTHLHTLIYYLLSARPDFRRILATLRPRLFGENLYRILTALAAQAISLPVRDCWPVLLQSDSDGPAEWCFIIGDSERLEQGYHGYKNLRKSNQVDRWYVFQYMDCVIWTQGQHPIKAFLQSLPNPINYVLMFHYQVAS